ncbi:MAG: hypothetical protein KQH57_08130 [Actinomycetales bacterium]|nr:hypothetical protein [Actinomycetales bacterium]
MPATTPTTTTRETVIGIWARVWDLAPAAVANQVPGAPQLEALCAHTGSALRLGARALQAKARYRPGDPFPLDAWLAETEQKAAETRGLRATDDRKARAHAAGVVQNRSADALRRVEGFPAWVVEDALERLAERLATAEVEELRLRRRAPRYRRDPALAHSGAVHVAADDTEVAIVAVLSQTAPRWTYSSTPDGRMFTHARHGYSAEGDRSYVDGLSDVVDTVSDVIARHRGGLGGRVYITQRHVECADCELVIAWVGASAGTRRTAVGTCSAVADRLSRPGRVVRR